MDTNHVKLFADRRDAGHKLALALGSYAGRSDTVVLGLPRGGVPVAYEVALSLAAPLDVFIVRKLGVPDNEELAMGAIASGGLSVLNDDIIRLFGITKHEVYQAASAENRELVRRDHVYRDARPPIDVSAKEVIVIDDGLATGATMRAAIQALRQLGPTRVVAAVPVAAPEVCSAMKREADEIICLATPEPFHAVGLWYQSFPPTGDEEVRELLDAALRRSASRALPSHTGDDYNAH